MIIIEEGNSVYCDLCNADGDDVDENGNFTLMGGCLYAGNAVCPECMAEVPESAMERVFDPNKSFGDNVRAYRMEVHGDMRCLIILDFD